MGLVLTLKKDEDFFIDREQFVLVQIVNEGHLKVVRSRDKKAFNVVSGQATEIAPDVLVSLGDRIGAIAARINVDAPRDKRILSGVKFRASGGKWINKDGTVSDL